MKKRGIVVLLTALLLIIPLEVSANSYVVMDAKTSRVLKGSNVDEKMPIASLTKIWTALVAVNEAPLDMKVRINNESVLQEGSSIYLQKGKVYTLEHLLYGLLLRSGNDAAHAIAVAVGGSEKGFVTLMNDYARQFGLENTTFTNPSGLPDPNHLSTSRDTAKMLKLAMDHPKLKKIISSKMYEANGHVYVNKHRLLHEDVGAISGKTGFTKVAGRTLATYFQQGQEKIIVVTLKYANDWNVHRNLAEQTFQQYKYKTIVPKGVYFVGQQPYIRLNKPIKLLVKDGEKFSNRIVEIRKKNEAEWQVLLHNKIVWKQRIKLH